LKVRKATNQELGKRGNSHVISRYQALPSLPINNERKTMYLKQDNTEQTERNETILAMYKKGQTYMYIANHVGVTKNTVAGVISRNKRKRVNAFDNL
jgi:DNA-binding NarL/FixJ family response regulator